jgi:two-component SAPR family response regulator
VSLAGKTVLIVEDQYLLALYLRRIVEEAGGAVLGPVVSAGDALALATQAKIDAAILDVKLQDNTSIAVGQALDARQIAFVIVTGYDRHVVPRELQRAPYLGKPIIPDQLVTMLASAAAA